MLNRLILKTILQKNIVLKLMRYLALSLVETSSIKNSIAWLFDVEKFEPLELVSTRDELHKIFYIPLPLARTRTLSVLKKLIWLELVSSKDEFR